MINLSFNRSGSLRGRIFRHEFCINCAGAAVSALYGQASRQIGRELAMPWEGRMHNLVYESLFRQGKALQLLCDLLEEEYRNLLDRDTDAVVAVEFSVQELIRHLALEKTTVIKALGGMRVAEYAKALPDEQGAAMLDLLRQADAAEQAVARQASRNTHLSLALLDQSSRTLQALTSQAMPPKAETYGRRGGMRTQLHPQAALISGRL